MQEQAKPVDYAVSRAGLEQAGTCCRVREINFPYPAQSSDLPNRATGAMAAEEVSQGDSQESPEPPQWATHVSCGQLFCQQRWEQACVGLDRSTRGGSGGGTHCQSHHTPCWAHSSPAPAPFCSLPASPNPYGSYCWPAVLPMVKCSTDWYGPSTVCTLRMP